MVTCGNCKKSGQTIEHVRACFAAKTPVKEAANYKPMFKVDVVPNSDYALETPEGIQFFRVRTGNMKWAGFQFVDRLIGAPGDWRTIAVKGAHRIDVLHAIALDPKENALRFSREFTVCACCGSPLSDPKSLELGFGPVCVTRFG